VNRSMFIDEQKARFYDLQESIRNEAEFIERHVWSPIANRHTSWTYRPLVRCTSTGRMVQGSRHRCPFILTEAS
jgi:hypothetical protein